MITASTARKLSKETRIAKQNSLYCEEARQQRLKEKADKKAVKSEATILLKRIDHEITAAVKAGKNEIETELISKNDYLLKHIIKQLTKKGFQVSSFREVGEENVVDFNAPYTVAYDYPLLKISWK